MMDDTLSTPFHPKARAPPCRLTSMCVALIATLSGLVMLGIGGVMAGFLSHEQFLYIVGLVLVAFGCILLIGGFIVLVIEMVRQKQPEHQAREAYGYNQDQSQTSNANSVQMSALSSQSGGTRRPGEAPPSYDSVIREGQPVAANNAQNQQQQPRPSNTNRNVQSAPSQPQQRSAGVQARPLLQNGQSSQEQRAHFKTSQGAVNKHNSDTTIV